MLNTPIPDKKLTPRETQVITFTAYGKTRSEISQILSISEETVKAYIERTCRKLNAVNKTHAATVALTLGLISPYKTFCLGSMEIPDSKPIKNRVPQTGNAARHKSPLLPRQPLSRKNKEQ
jgi:DNA-binding CsgD family transcriptional regulator